MPLYKIKADDTLEKFEPKTFGTEEHERKLETWVEKNPTVLIEGEKILFISRQRGVGKGTLDLLGIDRDGNTIIVELKRGATPREVIAQALEYAAEVGNFDEKELAEKAIHYFEQNKILYKSIREAFEKEFAITTEGIEFNSDQRIIIVGEQITKSVENVINFLRTKYGVPISCVEFEYYKCGKERLLSIETKIGRMLPTSKKVTKPRWTMGTFLEGLNKVDPKLQTRFNELKELIENLWKDRITFAFPYECVIDFRIPKPTGTVVSLTIQTKRNRFELYLKFGDKILDDPRKKTEDITRFGFGKLNRRLYIEPHEEIGVIDEKGSIANLLKQVHRINP